MSIKSLEMTSKMLAVILKKPGISWPELISELSIPRYDKRAKPLLKESLIFLTECNSIEKSGKNDEKTFKIPNPQGLPNGNLLISVYNQIELKLFSDSTDMFNIAKSILIYIYDSGSEGIDSEILREKFPKISDEQYSSSLELIFELKSLSVKEEGDSYVFEGNPIALLTLVNNELNILTGDIDELEESYVKKVNFVNLSQEDKDNVVLTILSNVPKTKKSTVSRNYIARKYSGRPEVKHLGRQIIIDLIDLLKENDFITTVESKSGKRDYLYLTPKGKSKLKELSE